MEGVSEIVEDWANLVQQIHMRTAGKIELMTPILGAILILARELRDYRRWAEEHHSS